MPISSRFLLTNDQFTDQVPLNYRFSDVHKYPPLTDSEFMIFKKLLFQ